MTLTYRQAGSIIGSLSGSDRTIPLYITYVDLTGDHVAALFLAQVLYWSDRTKDGWFYKTGEEWHEELRLTYKQVSRVSKLLAPIGLESRVRKHKGAPKTFYRINYDVFIPVAQTFVDTGFSPLVKITKGENDKRKKSILPKGKNPGFCPKVKIDFAEREESSISYSQDYIALDDYRDDSETPIRVSEPSPPEKPLSLEPDWEGIAKECEQLEAKYIQPNTSLLLEEKPIDPNAQPISSPGANIPPVAFLSPEETVIISTRENACRNYEDAFQERTGGLPAYRSKRGKNGIKPEFVEAIAKYLNTTPHYREAGLKAGKAEAKNHILDQEHRGKQEVLEERYQKYCTTPKSTGVEGKGTAPHLQTIATTTESLITRVKSGGLMAKWNQKNATEV